MARTTSAAVQAILLGEYGQTIYETSPDLTPFIETASAIVDDVVECSESNDRTTLDSTRAELVERWLAAHFYQQADPGYQSKSTGGASGSFLGRTDMYIESTRYGQTAVRLDKSGCLETLAGKEKKKAGAVWLGLPPSEQTPYYQRD